MNRMVFAALSAAAIAAWAAAADGAAHVRRGADEAYYAAVSARFDELIEAARVAYGIPGVIAGVEIPGRATWVKTPGRADLSSGAAPRYDDKFRAASLTKTFTATVVLQLAEEGRLGLGDTLDRYGGGYGVADASSITIRMLLDMTSGIFDFGDDEEYADRVAAEPLKEWRPRELVDIAGAHEPYFPPGEDYHYSNTNYVLLGMIVEEVTGRTIGEEVEKRIVAPLGLAHTRFAVEPRLTGAYMRGYFDPEGSGVLRDISLLDPSCSWAAGAVVSNMPDLAVWVRALVSGELLGAAMHREQLATAPGGVYGLGIMRGGAFWGHEGHILGYNSVMMCRPEDGTTLVVAVNRCPADVSGVAGGILGDLARALFPVTLRVSAPEAAAGEPVTVAAAVNRIVYPFDAYAVVVTPSGAALSILPGGRLAAGIAPYAAGRASAAPVDELVLMRAAIPPGAERGTYRLVLALTDPGAPASLSAARASSEKTLVVR